MMTRSEFVMEHPRYSSNQHCDGIECDYTMSHTAVWCGKPQNRFCECPYDYKGWDEDGHLLPNGEQLNAEMRSTLVDLHLQEIQKLQKY